MSNSKILVDIKGGFGNQIFQYCFANYLKSMGYKVFVNTEYFKFRNKDTQDNTYRTLILNEKNFNLKKINRVFGSFDSLAKSKIKFDLIWGVGAFHNSKNLDNTFVECFKSLKTLKTLNTLKTL